LSSNAIPLSSTGIEEDKCSDEKKRIDDLSQELILLKASQQSIQEQCKSKDLEILESRNKLNDYQTKSQTLLKSAEDLTEKDKALTDL
jgi:hypothetical protein